MLEYFRKNQQVFITFIIFYCLLSVYTAKYFQGKSIFTPIPFHLPLFGGWYNKLVEFEVTRWLIPLLTTVLILVLGFLLVRISISYLILPQRAQFPALFYVTTASFVLHQQMFSLALPASVFLLLALARIVGSIEINRLSVRFLDAGLLLALGGLLYVNILFLIPFLWLAQIILRQMKRREIFFTTIGVLLPFVYLFSIYFLFGKSVKLSLDNIIEWIRLRKVIDYNWVFLSGLGGYVLIMLIANFFVLRKFISAKIISRKLLQLFFYLFLNILLIFLLIPSAGIEIIFLGAVPVSILLSIYFSECRNNWFNRILFILTLLIPLLVQIFG